MAKILMLAKSGFGKSTSLGNIPELEIEGLDPKETFIISCVNKPLPFKKASEKYVPITFDTLKKDGKYIILPTDFNKTAALKSEMVKIMTTGNRLITTDAQDVAFAISIVSKSKTYKNIIVDDLNYISQDYYMKNSMKGGWDTPKVIGYHMSLIFEAINDVPEDKNIICMAHFEEYKDAGGDSLSYKFKSTGNMVDGYITPEGKFEIVLYGRSSYNQADKKSIREFVTNHDGQYPAKSPVGMFTSLYIPNDLGKVKTAIEEYYK